MTHKQKRLYHKIKDVIDYQTLNKHQGPTVHKPSVRQIVGGKFESSSFESAVTMLQKHEEIFVINRGKYREFTIWDDAHLEAIQEQESQKDDPNYELVGHINQMREKT